MSRPYKTRSQLEELATVCERFIRHHFHGGLPAYTAFPEVSVPLSTFIKNVLLDTLEISDFEDTLFTALYIIGIIKDHFKAHFNDLDAEPMSFHYLFALAYMIAMEKLGKDTDAVNNAANAANKHALRHCSPSKLIEHQRYVVKLLRGRLRLDETIRQRVLAMSHAVPREFAGPGPYPVYAFPLPAAVLEMPPDFPPIQPSSVYPTGYARIRVDEETVFMMRMNPPPWSYARRTPTW